jgi:uncharacterized NAD-dependent epimerase/dehydratase family protein
MEQTKPLNEKEAKEAVERLEREFGVNYAKRDREKEIKRLMGRAPWFD